MKEKARKIWHMLENDRILNANEVRAFLSKIPGMPEQNALEQILYTWNKNGFSHHIHLYKAISSDLIDAQMQDLCSAYNKKVLINEIIDAAYNEDRLMKCYDKSSAPLISGFAHLYTFFKPDIPVCEIKIDVGNVGGTNEFFFGLLKRTKAWEKKSDTEAMLYARSLTDDVIRAMLTKMRKDLDERCQLYLTRSGGDEFSFITIGTPYETIQNQLDLSYMEVAKFICAGMLNKHPHLKHLKTKIHTHHPILKKAFTVNPMKGINLGYGCILYNNRTPEEINAIDLQTEINKLKNYYNSAGIISKEQEKSLLKLFSGKDMPFVQKAIDKMKVKIYNTARKNKALGEKCHDPLSFIARIKYDFPDFYDTIETPKTIPEVLRHKICSEKGDASFPNIADTVRCCLINIGNEKNIIRSDFDRLLLESAGEHLTLKERATGALRDRPMLVFAIVRIYEDAIAAKNKLGDNAASHARIQTYEFNNLQALNYFGHNVADKILNHYRDIIERSLQRKGINPKNIIYSRGGGVFDVLLPSYVKTKHTEDYTSFFPVTEEFIAELDKDIALKLKKEINDLYIADYFDKHGIDKHYPKGDRRYGQPYRIKGKSQKDRDAYIYDKKTEKPLIKFSDMWSRKGDYAGISVSSKGIPIELNIAQAKTIDKAAEQLLMSYDNISTKPIPPITLRDIISNTDRNQIILRKKKREEQLKASPNNKIDTLQIIEQHIKQ